jgi:hypothetical protein
MDIQTQLIKEGFNVTSATTMKDKDLSSLLKTVFKHFGEAGTERISQSLATEHFKNWPELRKIINKSFVATKRLQEYINLIRYARHETDEAPSTFWFRLLKLLKTASLVNELVGGHNNLSRADRDLLTN